MRFIGILSLILILALAGCRQSVDGTPVGTAQPGVNGLATSDSMTAIPSYRLVLSTDPAVLSVGQQVVLFDITAPDSSPVLATEVQLMRVQGDMTHAGMAPVVTAGEGDGFATGQAGRFAVPFDFNMGGDWILSATVTLADGTLIDGVLNVSVR